MTTGRGPRWRRPLLTVLGLGAAALAADVLYNSSDELLTAADTLSHLSWAWVGVALVAEAASYLVRGAAQAVVLRRGTLAQTTTDLPAPRTPGPVVLGGATLAGDAAAYCLPFGFAASGVVMFGVLRRRHVNGAVAGWMFAVSTLLYVGAVSVLTVLAVQVAGDADPIPGLQQVGVGVLVALALLAAVYTVVRRTGVGRGWWQARHSARPIGNGRTGRLRLALSHRVGQLRAIHLPLRTGTAAFGLMLISWACDISVLGIAYAAVNATPPWSGLLLAYCAGQLASAFPVTPGGIGVVEGSLTLALVAFGGAQTVTLAAVLLYRLITYWACIPLGGLVWLWLRASSPEGAPSSGTGEPVASGVGTR